MAYPSGFGILALYPGISNIDPPGFSFYQIDSGTQTLQAYIQSATGLPQLMFSINTGEVPPLDFITGIGNSFTFDRGLTFVGNSLPSSANRKTSGQFNIYYNGNTATGVRAGLEITQTNTAGNSGNPVLSLRDSSAAQYSELNHHFTNTLRAPKNGGGTFAQSLPGVMAVVNPVIYSDSAFSTPTVGNSSNPSTFQGFNFSRYDGTANFYTSLNLFQDFVEIGYFRQEAFKPSIGGQGSVVLRNVKDGVSPTSNHPSGITLFSNSGQLHAGTPSGHRIKLLPGITGIDQLAHSSGIYRDLDYGVGTTATIDMSFDGRIAVDNKTGGHIIEFPSSLKDGFSCEIIYRTPDKATFDNQLLNYEYTPSASPGRAGITTVQVFSGELYLQNSDNFVPISLFSKNLYPTITSGAATGQYQTSSNRVNFPVLDFDASLREYAQGDILFPRNSNGFRCQFLWTAPTGAGDVRWGFTAQFLEDGEPLSNSFPTTTYVTDTRIANNYFQKSSFTSRLYPGGLIGEPENMPVKIQVERDGSHLSDTLNSDARLIGIILYP